MVFPNKSESQKKYYFGCCSVQPDKKVSAFQENGGELERENAKRFLYPDIPADLLARCQQARPPLGRMENRKMKNPVYFRVFKDGHFVGFKRIVTEYMPASHNVWSLDRIEHDPEATQKLSKPAMGIGTMRRERIASE